MWNPAAERVFGWTAAEVLGKPLPFIPAEKADEHRSMRERDLMGDNFVNREVRRHRKDGTPIDITVSTAPMRDDSGQITGIMSVYVDITEQKRHAEDQRRSLEMLRIIERQLMLLVDASGTLLASPESAHVLETIIRLAQQFIDAEAYAVWRKNTETWELVASAGLSATYERTVHRNNESTRAVPSEPVLIEDVETCEFVRHRLPLYREEGIRSMLTIPLHIHGEVGGTIVFYYRTRRTPSPMRKHVSRARSGTWRPRLWVRRNYMDVRQSCCRRLRKPSAGPASLPRLGRYWHPLWTTKQHWPALRSSRFRLSPTGAVFRLPNESGGLRHIAVEHVESNEGCACPHLY